jgi:hypothetical protein
MVGNIKQDRSRIIWVRTTQPSAVFFMFSRLCTCFLYPTVSLTQIYFFPVYVPPDGTTRMGSKDGVHFFTKLDKAAEYAMKATNGMGAKAKEEKIPIKEESASSEAAGRLLTGGGLFSLDALKSSLSLVFAFFRKDEEGRFLSALWIPVWTILQEQQARKGGESADQLLSVEEWNWTYQKGSALMSGWVYGVPGTKGIRAGKEGVDYFCSERAVIARVLQEVDSSKLSVTQNGLLQKAHLFCQNDPIAVGTASNETSSRRRKRTRTPSSKMVRGLAAGMVAPKPKSNKPLNKMGKKRKASSEGVRERNSNEATVLSQTTMEGVQVLLDLQKASSSSDAGKKSTDLSNAPAERSTSPTSSALSISNNDDLFPDKATASGIEKLFSHRKGKKPKLSTSSAPATKAARPLPPASPQASTTAATVRASNRPPTYHLSQSPSASESSSRECKSAAHPKMLSLKAKHMEPNGDAVLYGMTFLVSGCPGFIEREVQGLGGRCISSMDGISLNRDDIGGKLCFLSEPKCRRRPKYLMAVALGLPMLHFDCLKELEEMESNYQRALGAGSNDGLKRPALFDTAFYKKWRLPTGLSLDSGLFVLQRARNASKWAPPGFENGGSSLLSGMTVAFALQEQDVEQNW